MTEGRNHTITMIPTSENIHTFDRIADDYSREAYYGNIINSASLFQEDVRNHPSNRGLLKSLKSVNGGGGKTIKVSPMLKEERSAIHDRGGGQSEISTNSLYINNGGLL